MQQQQQNNNNNNNKYIRRLRLILSTELSAKKNASYWIIGNTSTKIQLWNY
jgi:hypothetical protein